MGGAGNVVQLGMMELGTRDKITFGMKGFSSLTVDPCLSTSIFTCLNLPALIYRCLQRKLKHHSLQDIQASLKSNMLTTSYQNSEN